jgi:hypothetical protein
MTTETSTTSTTYVVKQGSVDKPENIIEQLPEAVKVDDKKSKKDKKGKKPEDDNNTKIFEQPQVSETFEKVDSLIPKFDKPMRTLKRSMSMFRYQNHLKERQLKLLQLQQHMLLNKEV